MPGSLTGLCPEILWRGTKRAHQVPNEKSVFALDRAKQKAQERSFGSLL